MESYCLQCKKYTKNINPQVSSTSIGFFDFIFKGKTLTEYTNLFSLNDFNKNDDSILNYFMSITYL